MQVYIIFVAFLGSIFIWDCVLKITDVKMVRMMWIKKWLIFPSKLVFYFLIVDDDQRCLTNLPSSREAITMSYTIN